MSRSTLPDLQGRFHQFVVAGDDTFRHDIVDDGRVDVDVRLAVYYDGYRLRLIEALETDFVALKAYLGEDKFDDMARAYIDAHTDGMRNRSDRLHGEAELLGAGATP